MTVRRVMRRLLPPAALDFVRRLTGKQTTFSRQLTSWDDAVARSIGYDSDVILSRVLGASRQVRDGVAAYERDSVLFDRIEYSFPVVATLLRAALENNGHLTVIDFGGALGSSYRECRAFLGDRVQPLRWSVVEQAMFVEAGRREMQSDELHFFETVQEATQDRTVDVMLFSGVLQYLPNPYATIDQALRFVPKYVAIDRTIVSARPVDTLHVQRVPKTIYSASYPVWALSKERMLASLEDRYELLSEHASLQFPELAAIGAEFKGFTFRAKDAQ